MAKKQTVRKPKEVVKKELVFTKQSAFALEEVVFIKDFGRNVKGDKDVKHTNTAELLRFNGIIK